MGFTSKKKTRVGTYVVQKIEGVTDVKNSCINLPITLRI